MAYTEEELKKELETKEYEYGFYTDIESDTFPVGLNEDIVRAISTRKGEPAWMTKWRLEAFDKFQQMEAPDWANVNYKKPNFYGVFCVLLDFKKRQPMISAFSNKRKSDINADSTETLLNANIEE